MRYILAIDQGTSSSRAIVYDEKFKAVACGRRNFKLYYPSPGMVEQDALEIYASVTESCEEAVANAGIRWSDIAAIGITNQRETTIVWDRADGKPVCNAIVWQDRRTAAYCESLKSRGLEGKISERTGLLADPYFSGTKVKWILDNVPGARDRADRGELLFGTVDSWLIWKLTGGKVHVTDVSNASRTLLLNIDTLQWDAEMLKLLDIPESLLPEVRPSAGIFGTTVTSGEGGIGDCPIPIAGVAGDQQSALFGQMCIEKGMMKNTYGTGCFLLMNTGSQIVRSRHKLLSTVAWKIGGEVRYALEGSVFVAGSLIQWLKEGLGLISCPSELEPLAQSVPDNGGVYIVPALTGLGAPYWDPEARGSINGITRGTVRGHIARAAIESVAFEAMDLVEAMLSDVGLSPASCELRVDGGVTCNDMMMQFQSDILGMKVVRPSDIETTSLGAACLASLGAGLVGSVKDLQGILEVEKVFVPSMEDARVQELKAGWKDAVSRTLSSGR